jgi:hypothetical protein
VTAQFHFLEYFWPEFGFNDTQWTSGERAGRNQLLARVGIMFGRFQIYNRVKFNFGIALSRRGRARSWHNQSADAAL